MKYLIIPALLVVIAVAAILATVILFFWHFNHGRAKKDVDFLFTHPATFLGRYLIIKPKTDNNDNE